MKDIKIAAAAMFLTVAAVPAALAQYASQEPAAWASIHPEASIYSTTSPSFTARSSYAEIGASHRPHRAGSAKLRRKQAAE